MGDTYALPMGLTKSGDNDALRDYVHEQQRLEERDIEVVGNCWFNSIYFDPLKARNHWRTLRYGVRFLVTTQALDDATRESHTNLSLASRVLRRTSSIAPETSSSTLRD